jgi:hypothetical protein
MAGNVLDPAVIQNKIRTNMPWDFSNQGTSATREWGAVLGNTRNQPTEEEKTIANKDYQEAANAAIEYFGENVSEQLYPLKPGETPREATAEEKQKFINSDKGKELTKKFFEEAYKDELSNAYASTVDPKTAKVIDDFLLRNPQGLKYFDSEGNEIAMLDSKGKITDDWKDLTGGASAKFNYANTLNPMNFRAGMIKEDAAANGLHMVNAMTEDGMKSFYVSNPVEYNPVKKNTTILYNKLWAKPGVYQPTPDGNEAKVLVGKQKELAWETHKDNLTKQFGSNARRMFDASQGLTEVKLPNGQLMLTTVEALGLQLANNGIELSFKQ